MMQFRIYSFASSVDITESDETLIMPEEEYFEEQTEENTVTAKKTKELKVVREEDIVNKRIFIGDSRTVAMCLEKTNLKYTEEKTVIGTDEIGDLWIAKSGEGLAWMKEHDGIENEIIEGTNIYIMMGVNDCRFRNSWHLYKEYISEKEQEWEALGAKVIFISVLPLSENAKSVTTNEDVKDFNDYIKTMTDIQYLDIYSLIEGDVQYTSDGIHYTEETYKDIYSLITTSKI